VVEVVGWEFESEEGFVEVAWTSEVQVFEKDGQKVGVDEEREWEVVVG